MLNSDCQHMCVDMCMDMCIDMCIDVCVDVCVDMRADMCVDMCVGTGADTCANMCAKHACPSDQSKRNRSKRNQRGIENHMCERKTLCRQMYRHVSMGL